MLRCEIQNSLIHYFKDGLSRNNFFGNAVFSNVMLWLPNELKHATVGDCEKIIDEELEAVMQFLKERRDAMQKGNVDAQRPS